MALSSFNPTSCTWPEGARAAQAGRTPAPRPHARSPTSPFGSAQPGAPLPVGGRLRGFPRRRPGGRGCVPGGPPGSVPRAALAGFFPNSLFIGTVGPDPVSVLAGVSVPPPVPVPVPPLAPASLPAPVPGSVPGSVPRSVPLSLGVAVSVRAGLPVWVPLSRPGPGFPSPRRISHGSVPRPRPAATRGQQSPQVSQAGGQARGGVRRGGAGRGAHLHAHAGAGHRAWGAST